MTPYGALQAFGRAGSTLNKNGVSQYGGQTLDHAKGTIRYGGMERYCIALGPYLQNQNFTPGRGQRGTLVASEMAYGTCVDVAIALNNTVYYIPAIIADVKEHTYPSGVIQTNIPFSNPVGDPYSGARNIVEWYTLQMHGNHNKSYGLGDFSQSGTVIFYRSEVLY